MPGVVTSIDRTNHHGITISTRVGWPIRERSVRILSGLGAGVRYGVHSGCLKNLARGVVERVLCVLRDGELRRPPQPEAGVFELLAGFRDRFVELARPTRVVAARDYSSLYDDKRKRQIYDRAASSLLLRGIDERDAWVNTFVKAEKVNFTSKPDPAPRVIQPRSPRYNLAVGCYLKLFEKRAFATISKIAGYDVVLKGMNASAVGAALHSNWNDFVKPVAIGLDASRFDQHVSRAALEYEHSFYNGVFKSDKLSKLLRMQLRNRGRAYCGQHVLDYEVDGCRMSGDINTSLGNCILMVAIALGFCENVGLRGRLANNGDDCVLFLEARDLSKLGPGRSRLHDWFLRFGFTLTSDEPVDVFEKIVFCQAQPVQTSTGWRMVRDIATAPSKDLVSLQTWQHAADRRAWAGAIGVCGAELAKGVPVWEAFYSMLLRSGESRAGTEANVRDTGMGYMARGVVGADVDDRCRVSFYNAFGITPSLQRALEAEYAVADAGVNQPMISRPTYPNEYNFLTRWFQSANSKPH